MPTNVGVQTVSIMYHSIANAATWNVLNEGITPTGVYSGGFMSVINGTTAQVAPLKCQISDGTYQVKVATASAVNITVSSVTPYVVLRWSYGGTVNDYMEILAVASPADNDLVVGKCTFSGGGSLNGFGYGERSNPSTKDSFLKVESTGETELRVRIRGGYYQSPTASVQIPDQKSGSITPPLANSRVYLIYVDAAGAIAIDSSGTPAASPVAPSYANKLVLAEVTVSSTDTSIPASQIKDVRSFITRSVPAVDDTTITTDASGNLKTRDQAYLVARTVGSQLSNSSTWVPITLAGAVKSSNISPVVLGVYTLAANRLYKISYSVVFKATHETPTFESRLRVTSGDTSWWLDDNANNVSHQKHEAEDGNAEVTLSGTYIILPTSITCFQLEVKTRDAFGQYGSVVAATVSIWAE